MFALAAMVSGVAAVILVRPQTAGLLFFFLTYVNAPVVLVHFHGVPAPLAAATVGLLLIPAIQYVVAERQADQFVAGLSLAVAFCAIQLVSTLFAEDKIAAQEAVVVYLTEGLLLYLLVTNTVRTPEMLRQVTWVLLFAGIFMGGLVVFQKVTDTYWRDYLGFAQVSEPDWNAYGEHEGGRWPSGPIGDKNYFAQFLLLLFPLGLFRFWGESNRGLRWLALLATIVILAGVGLTGSRGAAIGFVATGLVMIAAALCELAASGGNGLGERHAAHAVARISTAHRLDCRRVHQSPRRRRPGDGHRRAGKTVGNGRRVAGVSGEPAAGCGPGELSRCISSRKRTCWGSEYTARNAAPIVCSWRSPPRRECPGFCCS